MFDRNRSWLGSIGLIVCILIASGAAWLLLDNASTLQRGYEQSAKNGADDYAKRRDVIIEDRCLPMAAKEKAACINEENQTARQGKADEYDLEAQRITATWTAHMGVAAIIGMAASLIGVGLIFVTFQATRRANDIAQQSHIAQTRAWLIVEGLEVEWRYRFEDGQIKIFGEVWFVLKNTGNSAASEIWTRNAVGRPQGIWEAMWSAEEYPLGPECLPPQGTTRVAADFAISIPLKPNGNALEPQAACLQVAYSGGGAKRFMTECIWTISCWSTDAEARWTDAFFPGYAGKSVSLDAHGHFGYFRTVT